MELTQADKKAFDKELLALAVPLALQELLTALVGASDALMLGRLTQQSIAAVSLANQISFVMSLFTGSAVGAAGVLAAQYWGKKDYKNAKRFAGMAVRYSAGIALVFFLLAFFIPKTLMSFFTPEAELIEIGAQYLRVVSFSYLFMGLSRSYLMMMRISGFVSMTVKISAVTVIVDMIADFFLIYGIGPVPALGAVGTAYSTIVVEILALVWCILWTRKRENLHLDKDSLTYFSKAYEKDIWKIIPGMLASALAWGLSITAHSFIIGHMGTDATAAYSVTAVAQGLIQCVSQALGAASGIMIGHLLGANELEKAKAYEKRFWKVCFLNGAVNLVLTAIIGVLVYVFYNLEPQAKSYLVKMLLFMALYMVAYCFNTIYTVGIFPAGGDSRYDAISVILATWCFAIPLALLGCFVFHWPVMVVFVVMCLDEIVKVPFIPLRNKKYIWLKNLTRDEN
ncbi:MAG: polysaccharide biosynthesis C-terminal domain-containing protein [Lachnospiraceae bacterium]|nr:polysaccharide biosynthesis C-terminal domain-containing protein [Lachnospiraceae bacterium]